MAEKIGSTYGSWTVTQGPLLVSESIVRIGLPSASLSGDNHVSARGKRVKRSEVD